MEAKHGLFDAHRIDGPRGHRATGAGCTARDCVGSQPHSNRDVKVAVTGADGFVGSWLVRHLEDTGDEAWSFVGPGGSTSKPSQIRLDITDQEDVTTHLARIEPEVVFHLAAISHGPTTSQEPDRALAVTVGGTIHLLAAVAGLKSNPLVVLSSSAEVYRRADRWIDARALARDRICFSRSGARLD